jgi:hypothetical protein
MDIQELLELIRELEQQLRTAASETAKASAISHPAKTTAPTQLRHERQEAARRGRVPRRR